MLWQYLLGILGALIILLGVVFLRAFFAGAKIPESKQNEFRNTEAEEKLSAAIRFNTVSTTDEFKTDWEQFIAFRHYLKQAFPLLAQEEWTSIVEHALIIRIQGTDKEFLPAAFLSHMDVVPSGDESLWKHPPFSGEIDDHYIHGRGAMDMKGHLIASLQAAEELLREGFRPQRDLYFCFGHDEEVVSGEKGGAASIVRYLSEKGIRFEFVVDEGGTVADINDALGKNGRAALICVAEKGYLDVELSVISEGGHSSRPPEETPLTILSQAVTRLQKKPDKLRLTPVMKEYYHHITPYASFSKRLFLANLWLFKGLFLRLEARSPSKAAMLHTTFVPTMAHASMQANVLPIKASMVCNMRLLQGDSIEKTVQRLKDTIRDPRVEITVLRGSQPSPVSARDSFGYLLMKEALQAIYPQALSVPYIMSGGTDSRHYIPLCDHIIKITPMYIEPKSGMHAPDERILRTSLAEGVEVFKHIMKHC